MGTIIIKAPGAPTAIRYGPYDVTDYATWQHALDAGVSAGSSVEAFVEGSQVTFIEVKAT